MADRVRPARLAVFTVSAPITAIAGWRYAYQRSYVSAGLVDAYFLILTAVILAVRRVLLGPIVGAALIVVQRQFASSEETKTRSSLASSSTSSSSCGPEAWWVRSMRWDVSCGDAEVGRPGKVVYAEKRRKPIERRLGAPPRRGWPRVAEDRKSVV